MVAVLGGLVVHTEQLTTADAFWLVTILGLVPKLEPRMVKKVFPVAGMDAAATLVTDRAPQKAGTAYTINKANASTKRGAPGSILGTTTGAVIAGV